MAELTRVASVVVYCQAGVVPLKLVIHHATPSVDSASCAWNQLPGCLRWSSTTNVGVEISATTTVDEAVSVVVEVALSEMTLVSVVDVVAVTRSMLVSVPV